MFFKLMPLDEDVGEVVGTVHKQVTRLFCPLATIKQVPLEAMAWHSMGWVEGTSDVWGRLSINIRVRCY